MDIDMAIDMAITEYARATCNYPAFHSPHEGLAVLLEEVEELKREVFTNHSMRSPERMTKEAVQVAAMALRFLADCC